MSIMNGVEASSKISEFKKTTPIIAMTADIVTGIDDKCKEFGINAYIIKPFDPSTLVENVYDYIKV